MMRKPVRPVNTERTLDDGTKVYKPICEENEICPICHRGKFAKLKPGMFQCPACRRAFIDPNRGELLGVPVPLETTAPAAPLETTPPAAPVALEIKGGEDSTQTDQVAVPVETLETPATPLDQEDKTRNKKPVEEQLSRKLPSSLWDPISKPKKAKKSKKKK